MVWRRRCGGIWTLQHYGRRRYQRRMRLFFSKWDCDLRCYYYCRNRGLEFLSLTGKVEGKRDRGKQRITFLYSLWNSATGGQSKGLNFLKLSDDRDVWRGIADNVCSRSGTWWWWWWWWWWLKNRSPHSQDEIIKSVLSFMSISSRNSYINEFQKSKGKINIHLTSINHSSTF